MKAENRGLNILYWTMPPPPVPSLYGGRGRVDTKWRFQFFAKYDYSFLPDVLIAIIATFFRLNDNRYFAIITNFFGNAIIAKIVILAINTIHIR